MLVLFTGTKSLQAINFVNIKKSLSLLWLCGQRIMKKLFVNIIGLLRTKFIINFKFKKIWKIGAIPIRFK